MTLTLSKVAALEAKGLWLVTARPARVVVGSDREIVAAVVYLTPSVE